MSEAARQDDPIAHSSALGGLLTGLAVGAAVALAGVAIVGTGGLAAVAIVGAGLGELIGSLSAFTSDAGQIIEGAANVFINGLAAARAHLSTVACSKHSGLKRIAEGSDSVYINGQPAARKGDRSTCDGKISAGSPNIFIGGGTFQTDDIDPEVPGWLHAAVFGIGIGSAILLGAGPGLIALGLAGGIAGGVGGHWLGGKIWGEGSDGQKIMAFGGAMLGGFVGGKGGQRFDAKYQVKVEGLGSNFGNVKVVPREQKNSFTGMLRGDSHELSGVKTENFLYVKRSVPDVKLRRNEFDSSARPNFLKDLSSTPEKVATLKRSGFSDIEIAKIQNGKLPNKEWQVHHINH
ncbi:hypothetical protein Pssp01_41100 [Pseudomonas sp. NBRC 100443]|nr:hypothetical protein Pssp01_41100 [Pseudomonas sp. NBRC 100443]